MLAETQGTSARGKDEMFNSLRLPRTHRFTLFPYTTLFRSPRSHPGCAFAMPFPTITRQSRFRIQRQRRHARRFRPSKKARSEEHTSELQSRRELVCRLLLEKKNASS